MADRATDVRSSGTSEVEGRRRWFARAAFAAAAAAVAVLLGFAGLRGIWLVAVGAAGCALTFVSLWWFLSRRGVRRWAAGALAVAIPVTVTAWYARERLLWVVLLAGGLWVVAALAGRAAVVSGVQTMPAYETPPPRSPFLIMNPRSGGGKVGRFGLVELARGLGAEVAVLDGPGFVDVAELARSAVSRGC